MADDSVYPVALDVLPTNLVDGAPHPATRQNTNHSALMKIEAELGVNPSAGAATVAARFTTVEFNVRTSSYTLALSDAGKEVAMNSASATVLTVPTNASVAYPVGTVVALRRVGAGSVTVTPQGGVTVTNSQGFSKLASQGSGATLTKYAADVWYLDGDVSA